VNINIMNITIAEL